MGEQGPEGTEQSASPRGSSDALRDARLRIDQIAISNYKGIDSFSMDFPRGVPDVFVFGSVNGLGKTSILECCALLVLALSLDDKTFPLTAGGSDIDLPDLLIRAGSEAANISGDIVVKNQVVHIEVHLKRRGKMVVSKSCPRSTDLPDINKYLKEHLRERPFNERYGRGDIFEFFTSICGFTSYPVVSSTSLFFHSYRKVQEGTLDLRLLALGRRLPYDALRHRLYPSRSALPALPPSAFKLRILRLLMSRAELFEPEDLPEQPGETLDKLNQLLQRYAGGNLGKLRQVEDTVELRVETSHGEETFSFDGLSSGQKEIISTLFLIWDHTKGKPSVVFIDEPELHLNARWQHGFLRTLVRLAPHNQYIVATHSEDVMDSVAPEQCVFLEKGSTEVNCDNERTRVNGPRI